MTDNHDTELRYGTRKVRYSSWERFGNWRWGVSRAFRELLAQIFRKPDKETFTFVLLRPGEEGYDEAMFSAVTHEGSPRYTYADGKWEQVK